MMMTTTKIDALSPAVLIGMFATALTPGRSYVLFVVLGAYVLIVAGYVLLLPKLAAHSGEPNDPLAHDTDESGYIFSGNDALMTGDAMVVRGLAHDQ